MLLGHIFIEQIKLKNNSLTQFRKLKKKKKFTKATRRIKLAGNSSSGARQQWPTSHPPPFQIPESASKRGPLHIIRKQAKPKNPPKTKIHTSSSNLPKIKNPPLSWPSIQIAAHLHNYPLPQGPSFRKNPKQKKILKIIQKTNQNTETKPIERVSERDWEREREREGGFGDDDGQRERERDRVRECNVHQLPAVRAGSGGDRSRRRQRRTQGRTLSPLESEARRAAPLLHSLVSPWPNSVRQSTVLPLTPLHTCILYVYVCVCIGYFDFDLLCGFLVLVSLIGLGSFQDFDKVWPIFDSAQSRDFRKVEEENR